MPKRILSLILLLCLFSLTAQADPVPVGTPLTGTVCWPDDATEANARYLFRYSLPHIDGDSEAALGINTFYETWLEDAVAFTVPINGESLEDPDQVSWTEVTGSVTCNGDYLSVRFETVGSLDGMLYETCAGHIFPLIGSRAGIPISLPYLLGILKEGENDTWLQDRQTAKADACVRSLIWDMIEADMDRTEGRTYLPDATFELFSDMFYPEEDFYLDESGNPVFFIQPGVLCSEEDGVLLFPLPLELILDEI